MPPTVSEKERVQLLPVWFVPVVKLDQFVVYVELELNFLSMRISRPATPRFDSRP